MFVVAPGDKFAFGQIKDWPWTDLVANGEAMLHFWIHDLGWRRRIEATPGRNVVPRNQHYFHPPWMMAKDRKEDVDNTDLGTSQWRAVRITEIGSIDDVTIDSATSGDNAFFNLHVRLNVLWNDELGVVIDLLDTGKLILYSNTYIFGAP